MRPIGEDPQFWKSLMDMLEAQFGNQCELVLHDLTKDYSETVVDIRNGYITGRKVGDCGSNLGLEVMRGTLKDGDRYNYITHTPSGRILRSSTSYFYSDEGKLVGALCINLDITNTIALENFLRQYNEFSMDRDEGQEEMFATDVKSLLDYFLKQAQAQVGKEPADMDKNDRIKFIAYLDKKGAFLISKSSEKACEYLGISKFTLYNYLESIRSVENGK